MQLIADECIDHRIVQRLRSEGYNVAYVAELAPGIADEAVLEKARQENALLLTTDKDFGELVFRQEKTYSGVLLIRLAGLTQDDKATLVVSVLHDHAEELSGAFTVVSKGGLRIRRHI